MKSLLKITLLAIISLGISLHAKAETKTKKITKTYSASSNLKVDTRYSRVEFKTWDKNEIKFEIEISAEGNKAENAQTMLNNITIDMTEGDDLIIAKTVFGDFFSLKKLSNSIFNKGKVKIDYTIYLPTVTKLDLVLKDSRSFIANHSADIKLDLTYSELTAENLSGKNDFELRSNCFLKIGKINEVELNIGGSEINIEEANKITGDSRDSKYKLGSIDNMNIKSSRDNFEIKEIESLYGSSSLSKFDISHLGSEIDYDINFGHLFIFNVDYLFSFVKLDSKFGNLGLSFSKNTNFDYEINHRAVKFDKTSAFDLESNKTMDGKKAISKGKFGSKNASSKVNIRANNCKLKLE
ncbi:hypothetical protein DWB61_14835 [Ancylomarina euxinus]|uniref:Adhesin domain-containing protein n=1 Tax=Ancylomarina euxinus TaxID=2283627 RepID=A0A425XY38_9BACT|nr:hypothetical protein [Ancylomarina euxinus]MCZ4695918.1 hypothetical protein [Ancylomarina euxinus]MUP16294.1 hypothetical protein [Ancylomarina euxinus]RRG19664.1 hypothetical protein DWB61_14835 [Ancylomarina euxinus]